MLSSMMFVTSISSHTPTWKTITNTIIFCMRNTRRIPILSILNSSMVAITMTHINGRKKHCKDTDNRDKGEIINPWKINIKQNQRMSQDQYNDSCIQKAEFEAIVFLTCEIFFIKKLWFFIGRFFQFEEFIKHYIQSNRDKNIGVNSNHPIDEIPRYQSEQCRKNPIGCFKQQLVVVLQKVSLIFSKKCSHFIPVLSLINITFLKSIQKLFSLENLELTCLFLQKHGAFLLGKWAKSFMFLGFFEAIPHLTHRICVKP